MKGNFIMATNDHTAHEQDPAKEYATDLLDDAIQSIYAMRQLAHSAVADPDDTANLLTSIAFIASQAGFLVELALSAVKGSEARVIGGAMDWLLSPRAAASYEAHMAQLSQAKGA